MPYKCSVVGCPSKHRSKSDSNRDLISYHRLPQDETRRTEWINRCRGIEKINDKHARVCSAHFDEHCFFHGLQNRLTEKPQRRVLKDDALPTKHLSYSPKRSRRPASCNNGPGRSEIRTGRAQTLTTQTGRATCRTHKSQPPHRARTIVTLCLGALWP